MTREQGRLLVEDMGGDIDRSLIGKIRMIFGIFAVCLCIKPENDRIDTLRSSAFILMQESGLKPPFSFKIETRRADKRYPIASQEISADIGGYILERMPTLTVDVHEPEVTIHVELRTQTYLYINSEQGQMGLPYGSSGKGILLLSGGIDSPVAGYLMARRGIEIVPVYFHSPPYASERALDKVTDLTRALVGYTEYIRLYVVHFTDIQLFLRERVQKEKLTLLLKRTMFRVAERISRMEGAHVLISGDSVGQVASQTAQSIAATDSAVGMPILRPLSGASKQEIVDTAMQIGTYRISIRPYDDCCTLFVAEHPENKPKVSVIEGIERKLEHLGELIDEAMESIKVIEYREWGYK